MKTDEQKEAEWVTGMLGFEEGFAKGKKVGIKEVADWIKEYGFEDVQLPKNKPIRFIYEKAWQKKLKEWGLDG